MLSRRLMCLLLLFFVALLSACLIPFGHGSFSAVHGPTDAFRSFGTLALLLSWLAIAAHFRGPSKNSLALDPGLRSPVDNLFRLTLQRSSLLPTLRC